ncbi:MULTISPECIES: hypothetical protein [unclassified Methylobacterium]|uniref:hypothetical protein n=1 Tax=unclassified Methylobacterium TaxID=2615210 RepID=UPI0011C1DA1A|nr:MULTISPECIES: hypothetical protein [unclassified Methylobacterium]QEE41643.1 hypothetical protein FVA80_24520 [Methylobacterium sp. WL1]TXN53848.1 hypothetical protein FV241_26445 [Methylobacterium sp. WL2]
MRTRRRQTGVQLATALTLASLAPSDAQAGQNFVQIYIDAQGGCASAAGPLAFVLAGGGLQAPFGKLAGDWTDTDLAALPAILSACERTAARVNSYLAAEVRDQARELETRVPKIVAAARAERARQAAQLQARRDLAQARIEAARRQAELPAAGPEDDVRRLEVEAGRAEAQARAAAGYRDRALRDVAEQRSQAATPRPEGMPNKPAGDGSQPAVGPTATFGFDAPSFRRMYDTRLRGDGDGGIEECAEQNMNYDCRFDDAPFRKSVEAFRKLDLARGSFSSKLSLSVVSWVGRASRIVLTGDRADPMNLFGFVGKVASLIKTLEPGIAEVGVQDLLSAGLSLTRGDDDPTIGAERKIVRGAYVARCRSAPSHESTAMTCTFEPRA